MSQVYTAVVVYKRKDTEGVIVLPHASKEEAEDYCKMLCDKLHGPGEESLFSDGVLKFGAWVAKGYLEEVAIGR